MPEVLVIDDDADISQLLAGLLARKGYGVKTAGRGALAVELLKQQSFDVVLCDHRLPDTDSLKMLEEIRALNPMAATIVITGYSDVRTAVELMRRGAFDYVVKPLYPDEILMRLHDAIASKQEGPSMERKRDKAAPAVPTQHAYVTGIGPQAEMIAKHVALVAPTNMTVLITGETGTGKEYVAKEIHRQSSRSTKPFIAVDCGALPKDLAGSELFGHVKGAFTGAIGDKTGSFVLAHGGTIFLDEIGNLSYENQVRLLRALQERTVKPVGGEKEVPVDVRVLTATNEDLRKATASGRFREDLFHRIDEFSIALPPLRERKADIPVFAEHFMTLAAQQLNKSAKGFAPRVLEQFATYPWPGNLREMNNVIKRATLLAKGSEVTSDCLPTAIMAAGFHQDPSNTNGHEGEGLRHAAQQAEREAILAALERNGYNRTRAAVALNIDRKTLYNKLKTLGLDP